MTDHQAPKLVTQFPSRESPLVNKGSSGRDGKRFTGDNPLGHRATGPPPGTWLYPYSPLSRSRRARGSWARLDRGRRRGRGPLVPGGRKRP